MQISGHNLRRKFVLAVIMSAAGCSHVPDFQAALPDRVAAEGKSIAVIGDLQQTAGFVRFIRRRENTAEQQGRLVADLHSRVEDFAALVMVGDLVYSARSERDWSHFDELMAPFADRLPILPAIGNHDYPCYLVRFCRTSKMAPGMAQRFPWLEPGQAYSVPAEDLLLLFLDSESGFESQAQWLRAQLSAAANVYTGALVFFHRPPFSNSTERTAKGDPNVQRYFVPVLREAPLPALIINGHIHGFEHIERDGMHFITTAGAGGPRVAMPNSDSVDLYDGPECELPENGTLVRPFNYVLLTRLPGRLRIDVRGFCAGDAEVRILDTYALEW